VTPTVSDKIAGLVGDVPQIPANILPKGIAIDAIRFEQYDNQTARKYGGKDLVITFAIDSSKQPSKDDPKQNAPLLVCRLNPATGKQEWKQPGFRDCGDSVGILIGAHVLEWDVGWKRSPRTPLESIVVTPQYKNAFRRDFSVVHPLSAFAPSMIEQWGQEWADKIRQAWRDLADETDGIFHTGTIAYHAYALRDNSLTSKDAVIKYLTDAFKQTFRYVRKTSNGYKPTIIQFLNEVLGLGASATGQLWVGYEPNSPLLKYLGETIISDIYLIMAEVGNSMGFELGRDYIPETGQYGIAPDRRLDYAIAQYMTAKQRIGQKLGIPVDQVPFNVSNQFRFDGNNTSDLASTPPEGRRKILSPEAASTVFNGLKTVGPVWIEEFNVANVSDEKRSEVIGGLCEQAIRDGVTGIIFEEPLSLNPLPSGMGSAKNTGFYNPDYSTTDNHRNLLGRMFALVRQKAKKLNVM
jgi:hypothetical protein